jgi:hypothetical protein
MPLRPRALPAGFIALCRPKSAPRPPSGELWLHEIKHDGFRVIAASFIARLLERHRWITYIGLAVILYVAGDMIYRGFLEVRLYLLSR